ncbi:MAG: translesion error-prone DNA polymerase V autoproteolytic subunit [Proteobacteria bacterium]|nr:MAG: translesion error-prone DNA polymerase V autoproteolytic subunit [Pseudomonadota bacterium]
MRLPVLGYVSCGFPSPAQNYTEPTLDLNEHLISKPSASFFVKAKGDSMEPEIKNGSLLIVDRSITAKNGDIILAVLNGEFTIKRFTKKGDVVQLTAENPKYKPMMINADSDFQVWGVAVHSIHKLR